MVTRAGWETDSVLTSDDNCQHCLLLSLVVPVRRPKILLGRCTFPSTVLVLAIASPGHMQPTPALDANRTAAPR